MKTLYAQDHRFIPLNGNVYSETQFHNTYWQRYLNHFDSLIVFSRKGHLAGKNKSDLVLSSAFGVTFAFAPDLSSLKAQVSHRAKAFQQIRKYLIKVDSVIVRLPSELGLVAISEANRVGLPWAVEVAGCPWDGLWNYGSIKGKIYAPFMAIRTYSAIKRAPFVLYVTQKFLQQRYPNKTGHTVSCSNVEIPVLSKKILNDRLAKINNKKSPVVFGLIGTLNTRYKGIQTVVKALSLARNDMAEVKFRILGDGDATPWIAEAVKQNVNDIVHFDGTLPPGEPVMNWLDDVDIYLQPSFKEGLPRALIEAMSRGCPAIASRCAGIPELLDKNCLIKPGDASHLKELMIKAIHDIEWQSNQAMRNWHEARNYSKDKLDTIRFNFWSKFAEYANSINR